MKDTLSLLRFMVTVLLVLVNVSLCVQLHNLRRQRDDWQRLAYQTYDLMTNAFRITQNVIIQRDYYMTNHLARIVAP